MVVDAVEVQVHEVRKVGTDEHLVILQLRDGVSGKAERPQVLEAPQVDDLARTGESDPFFWLLQSGDRGLSPRPSASVRGLATTAAVGATSEEQAGGSRLDGCPDQHTWVGPWARCLTSVSLRFPICDMGTRMLLCVSLVWRDQRK